MTKRVIEAQRKAIPAKDYTSKTKRGECANDCTSKRRNGSKYCADCSTKHHAKK